MSNLKKDIGQKKNWWQVDEDVKFQPLIRYFNHYHCFY